MDFGGCYWEQPWIPVKEAEFYRRAATDPVFRHEKLDELRYFKSVGLGLMCFCAAAAVAFSVYGGVTNGEWDMGAGMLVVAMLSAGTYALCKTRAAALEAFDAIKPATDSGVTS